MKKLLITAAILYGGYKLFGKKQQIDELKDKLRIRPQNFRNLKIVQGGVKMLVDIDLINESDLDFQLNSLGTITLRKINFFTGAGTPIGAAYPNISNITIPPHGTVLLPNVEAVISTANPILVLGQLLTGHKDVYTTREVEILGQKYII